MPSCLCKRRASTAGSTRDARTAAGSPARIRISASAQGWERRLAPMGSSRYRTFSSPPARPWGFRPDRDPGSWRESARASHCAGDAEADVVGAFVADDLRRHSRHDGAFDGGRTIGVDELFGQRCEESRRGRAESDANDVRVHAGAVDRRVRTLSGNVVRSLTWFADARSASRRVARYSTGCSREGPFARVSQPRRPCPSQPDGERLA